MRRLFFFVVAAAAACGDMTPTDPNTPRLDTSNGRPEPPMAGIQWARGSAHGRPVRSPNLVYHGGPIMSSGAYVEPIFWGPSWADASFAGDKMTGIRAFYAGVDGSSYAATNSEYTDDSGAHVGTTITLAPKSQVDLSTAPHNGNRTSVILDEVCSKASQLRPNGFYPVYVDQPRHGSYCAWHSVGTCPDGTTIQFAFFFTLDGDSGCDPKDTSGLHSQGLAALANVSGHELSEALTDPHVDAWYDSGGAENADKCAWHFGTPLLTLSNLTQWKVQGNWSNAAYNAGSGYNDGNDQYGCIDGGNYP